MRSSSRWAPAPCYLLFPGLLAGNYALYVEGLARGIHVSLLSLVLYVGTAGLVYWAEKRYPYERAWNADRADTRTDLAHITFNTSLVDVWKAVLLIFLVPVAAWLSDNVGLSLWPTAWPLWAQVPLALLVNELPQYWIHRLSHESGGNSLLWRWHAVHHSPRRLYSLNAMREHPFLALLLEGGGLIPLILLGIPADALGLFMLAIGVLGYLQHTNVDIRLGPLNHVFSLAELHRWHHVQDVDTANQNYGDNLILFDTLFGTRYAPTDRRVGKDDLGIEYLPNYPARWLDQVRSPGRWEELKAEGRRMLAGASAATSSGDCGARPAAML